MRTFYVHGTKKSANESIKLGMPVTGIEYKLGDTAQEDITKQPQMCVVKFWKKKVGDSPVAISYGNWDPQKRKIR